MNTTNCPGCSGCWVPARTHGGGLRKQMMWEGLGAVEPELADVTAGPATTCLRVVWTEPTPQISSEYILLLQDSETPPYPSSFWCTILMVITRECMYYCV